MIYKQFKGLELSALGLGTMRLPVIDGVYSAIDVEKTEEMIDYALKNGINYFDTAWGYHDGRSEEVVGEILSHYPRESYFLASKFPGYDLANMPHVEEIFEAQLKRCRVDHFDFYLIHNVCELNIDAYLDPRYGIKPYLLQQKKAGRIKHLGFSVHGNLETTKRFLEVYGQFMEFGQIQLNYLDYDFQAAKDKLSLLKSYDIPIWVMEPLRGGKLASLPPNDEILLKNLRTDETIPAWAFRFLQTIPEVTVVLSGMSNFDQLKANIATFATEKPLNKKELETIFTIAKGLVSRASLPCTGCRYCTAHCPKELPIPDIIELYNEYAVTEGGFIAPMRINTMPEAKRPSACIGCRSCEQVCPQQIKISEMMRDFSAALKQ